MATSVVIAGLVLSTARATTVASAQDAPTAEALRLEITYLGNAGFLLADGEHTVLVDGLFGSGLSGYPSVDAERRERLESATPPFDEVDIILATHHHADHFNAAAVARHLRANPRALFLSTPQAVERLRTEVSDFAPFAGRAHGILPAEGERHHVRLLGLDITLLHLHHGRNRQPPVGNLGFLLELGGRKLLHVGDTVASAEEFAVYELAKERIGVALVPFWLLSDASWRGVVREQIAPDEIVAMHLPVPDAPAGYFAPSKDLDDLIERIRTAYPDARVFSTPTVESVSLDER